MYFGIRDLVLTLALTLLTLLTLTLTITLGVAYILFFCTVILFAYNVVHDE